MLLCESICKDGYTASERTADVNFPDSEDGCLSSRMQTECPMAFGLRSVADNF